jgi:hypothetical protein
VVGEHRTFAGDAVDVRRTVAHDSEAVGADVLPSHVVGKQDQDVRLGGLGAGRDAETGADEQHGGDFKPL